MTDSQTYAIDILNITPKDSSCFIQAPNLENLEILNLMAPTEFEYFREVKLSDANREKMIEQIKGENIQEDFQSIEIKCSGQLLFEGYDGMEYGTISKNFKVPEWFIDKYINKDMCNVSREW